MVITRKIIWIWAIFFFPYLLGRTFIDYSNKQKDIEGHRIQINQHIGEKFDIEQLIDTGAAPVKIDFGQSDFTIMDFWFSDCPPCINEMQQFEKLIRSNSGSVSIISVSINSFKIWKSLLDSKDKKFSFLHTNIPNWKQAILNSKENPRLNNSIPADNLEFMASKFNSNSFPTYIVVDKNGTIVAAPFSAVDFIKRNILNQNSLSVIISGNDFWNLLLQNIFWTLIEYSGIFWLIFFAGQVLANRIKKHNSERKKI